MDGGSFFPYVSHNEGDYGFPIFDDHRTGDPNSYFPQGQIDGTYTQDNPMDESSHATHRPDSMPMIPHDSQVFTAPPPAYMPPHQQHKQLTIPRNPEPFKIQSPGLSNGSSSTPDTHVSAPLITPEDHPQVRQSNTDNPPTFIFRQYDHNQRKRDRAQRSLPPKDDPAQEEVRRNRSLEKNRVAATKCRQKKKEWMSDLEEKATIMERRRSELLLEKKNLRAEANQIKTQLMEHGNCHDANIDKWVENEAKRWVLMTGDHYDHLLANMNATPQQQQQQQQQQQALDDGNRTDSFSSTSTVPGYPIPTPNEVIDVATPASSFPQPQPLPGHIPFAPPGFQGPPPPPLNLQQPRFYRGDGAMADTPFPQVSEGAEEAGEDNGLDTVSNDGSDEADSVDFDQMSMPMPTPDQQHHYVY